ncbi:hypothetical protein DFQ30_010471 [Apophysomyces sp. BC1015]|nr:hypothetical protein DFQ30_010471 [Apophysomyces sp. BC1015]
MTQRNNSNSRFGGKYQDYWRERDDIENKRSAENRKRQKRAQITEYTCTMMENIAFDMAESPNKRQRTNDTSEDITENNGNIQDEAYEKSALHRRLAKLTSLSKDLELRLSTLNIVDLTNHPAEYIPTDDDLPRDVLVEDSKDGKDEKEDKEKKKLLTETRRKNRAEKLDKMRTAYKLEQKKLAMQRKSKKQKVTNQFVGDKS